MGVLGIVFGQRRSVIGVKTEGLGGELGRLRGILRQTIGGVAGIVVDATVAEEHITTAEVSDNPIEDGADVTDHVQMRPVQLTIDGVISDTPLGYAVVGNIQNVIRTTETLFGGKSRSIDAYNDLLALQRSREPFTVYTGLKRYENMIMTELSVPRTAQTGNAIHFRCVMRQVTIVKSGFTPNNLSESIKNLASDTVNRGNKVTPAVPATDDLAQDSTALTSQDQASILSRGWKAVSDWWRS